MGKIIESIKEMQDQIIMVWNDSTTTYQVITITFILCIIVGKCLQWELQQFKNKQDKDCKELKKIKVYDNVFLAVVSIMLITAMLMVSFPVLDLTFKR